MTTGTILTVEGDHGVIRPDGDEGLVKFSRSALLPAAFFTRGARAGDRVRFDLAFPGVASSVWLSK